MLQYLDTLIGFVMVMALMSMLITTMTQAVSAFLGLRGVYLRDGLKALLAEAVPGLDLNEAELVAEAVLHHHLVTDSTLWLEARAPGQRWPWLAAIFNRWKLATAVRKREFMDIFTEIANSPAPATPAATPPPPTRMAALFDRLFIHGTVVTSREITDNTRVKLKTFLEKPVTAATGNTSGPPPTGNTSGPPANKVEAWFDSTMDRVTQRFGVKARVWTVAFAFIIAFAIHLDSFSLLKNISSNPEMRAKLVAAADNLNKTTSEADSGDPNVEDSIQQIKDKTAEIKETLGQAELELLPSAEHFHPCAMAPALLKYTFGYVDLSSKDCPDWGATRHLLGILTSGVLLSLGAPFWFNTLKQLLNLRSTVANKDEKEKQKEADE